MAKTGLTVSVKIEGLRETLKAFNDLPKEASDELRDQSMKLSQFIALQAKASGKADTRQSALVADTVKAKRDRTPVVTAGGTTKIGRRGTPAYKILFGSMFGSNQYKQFGRPHAGREAFWFFPVIEENSAAIAAYWLKAADNVVRKFSEGG